MKSTIKKVGNKTGHERQKDQRPGHPHEHGREQGQIAHSV